MPKLLELQAKLTQVEAKLGSMDVPSDLLDQIDMMQKAIDSLQSQLSSVRLPVRLCVHIKPFMCDPSLYVVFVSTFTVKYSLSFCFCDKLIDYPFPV